MLFNPPVLLKAAGTQSYNPGLIHVSILNPSRHFSCSIQSREFLNVSTIRSQRAGSSDTYPAAEVKHAPGWTAPASAVLTGPSLFTSSPGCGGSPASSFSGKLGSVPSASKSEGHEGSSVRSGRLLPQLGPGGDGLPSREDTGLGLGPGPPLSDSGLLGSGDEAGLPQGPGANVRRADSWGHSASLSPEEEHGGKLTWGERQAEGQGAPQSRKTAWRATSASSLPAAPPPGAGQHVLSLLRLGTSHTRRQRAEGSQDSRPQATLGGSGLSKPLGPRHQKCWVFGTFLREFYKMSIFKPIV